MVFRKRRPALKWVAGQFDVALVNTAAATQRSVDLVGPGDIATAGIAGERCYVRRVVGTLLMVPQADLAADAQFKWALNVSFYNPAAGLAAYIDLDSAADFEDQRQLARREWYGFTGTRADYANGNVPLLSFVDWKGIAKLHEARNQLTLSMECSVAYSSFVRLRCLLQQPRV